MILDPGERPPDPACPACGATLAYVDTEVSSGAFRPQAASMPQIQIHYYDCGSCNSCWKFGTRLLPKPVSATLAATRKATSACSITANGPPPPPPVPVRPGA